jgi:DNA-binding GntR family transcriptional regulator
VLEHRLPPGTKLVEDRLAELFDTSRAQVRDVLAGLADEGVVSAIPNRGACIASPTPEETREVFEARRLIEPALVRRFMARRDEAAAATLRALLRGEEPARTWPTSRLRSTCAHRATRRWIWRRCCCCRHAERRASSR